LQAAGAAPDRGRALVDVLLLANSENDRICSSKIDLVRVSMLLLALTALGCIPIVALRP